MRLKVKSFCQTQRWGRAGTGTLDLMLSVEFGMLACPTLPPTGRRGKCDFISCCICIWNLVFKSLLTVMVSRGLSCVSRKHGHFQGRLKEKEEWCKMNAPRIKKGEGRKEKRRNLMAGFSSINVRSHQLHILLKMQIWIQRVWSGTWDSEFLASSQVAPWFKDYNLNSQAVRNRPGDKVGGMTA